MWYEQQTSLPEITFPEKSTTRDWSGFCHPTTHHQEGLIGYRNGLLTYWSSDGGSAIWTRGGHESDTPLWASFISKMALTMDFS